MIIKNISERNCALLSIICFFLHLLFLQFYPVNFEFSFSEGAKYLHKLDSEIIDEYFFNQANTFIFSIIVGLVDKVLFLDNTLVVARIISATSYLFFGFGFIKIFRYYKIEFSNSFFLLYFFLNPLIWTYGFRGIPDLFATSLSFYLFSNFLFLKNKKNIKNYLNFILFGLCISIKPFCAIYLALIFLIEFNKDYFLVIKKYFQLFILSSLVPVIYFILIKINFGFYLIPDEFANQLRFLKGGFIKNFFGYLILLSIFTFPLFFKTKFINLKNFFVITFILFPLSFYLNFLTNSPSAELNLGFLNLIIGDELVFFVGAISLYTLFLYLHENIFYQNKNKNNYKFLLIVFFYIIALSLTRSSQRYLITIIPIFMIFFLLNENYLKENFFFKLTIFSYILMNILIFTNFYLNSSINREVIQFLDEKKILKKTLPGPLYPHSYHFFNSKNKKEYIISSNSNNSIKTFKKKFFIFEKKFFLKKLN